jgi:lipoprotein-releasing system permease protein
VHFLFAWRYFKGKYTFQAIQIIAWVSVFAIAIGTAALITVLSVSNGFTEVVKGLYSDFYADINVTPTQSKFIKITDAQYHAVEKIAGVQAISKIVMNKALLVKGNQQSVVTVKGVGANYHHINRVSNYLKRGVFDLGNIDSPKIVIGIGVEQRLGLFQEPLGDTLQLFAVRRNGKSITQLDQLNTLSVVQSGAFSIQQEFDEQYIYTNDAFSQYLFDLAPDEISGIELAIDPIYEQQIKTALKNIFGTTVQVQNKYQQNIDLYKIMQTEKWIIFFILALIMIVASFNLVGALTMLVLEKQKDIYVLQAMGATSWDVQKIFLLLSVILSFLGAMIGGLLSSIFCWLQLKYHLIKLQGNSFVIDYYPVKPMLVDYIAIIGLVLFISILAGWMPARRAANSYQEKI